jgi:hypothetical protein
MMKKVLMYALCVVVVMNAAAQTGLKTLLVDANTTGAGIEKVHSPHLLLYNNAVPSVHRLFLMIVGTGGSATDMRTIDSTVAGFGYHTISLDYKNNVITTVCVNSPDQACFDHFRQEIMFGTPVSDSVNVDSTNSIINRFTKLLLWCVTNDPAGGWGEFIKDGKVQWQKIVVAGHSQGAGHSAYIGKHFKVAGVLMLSGPQDYRAVFHSPATWQAEKSATPSSKYFAFLHIRDQFDVTRQLADCAAVMGTATPDSTTIQPNMPVTTNKHILVNRIETNNPHMSTLLPQFKEVWRYMLNAGTK